MQAIERWVRDNRPVEEWQEDPRVRLVRYEELVRDCEETLRGVCDFLGESYEPAMLDFHERPSRLFTGKVVRERPDESRPAGNNALRNWQINKLFDGSGKWKGEMTGEEKNAFKERAGRMLIRLGYAAGDEW